MPRPRDEAKTTLGNLCVHGHDHEGTGQSLRWRSSGACIACVAARKRKPNGGGQTKPARKAKPMPRREPVALAPSSAVPDTAPTSERALALFAELVGKMSLEAFAARVGITVPVLLERVCDETRAGGSTGKAGGGGHGGRRPVVHTLPAGKGPSDATPAAEASGATVSDQPPRPARRLADFYDELGLDECELAAEPDDDDDDESEPVEESEPDEDLEPDEPAPRRQRATTISIKQLTAEELRIGALLWPERVKMPTTRGECAGGVRPCPYVGCKYHLFLDVDEDIGSIKLNFPDLEPWELEHSCALDIAAQGGATLEEVGQLLNVTRERVRQIEMPALVKVRRRGGEDMLDGWRERAEQVSWAQLWEEARP